MKPKHKKHKNTGILFELLVRQITNDTLDGVENSPAIRIVKEYFKKNTTIKRELLLYQAIQKSKFKTEEKANRFIDAVIEEWNKLNKSTLRKQKYNLIKEIRNNFNEELFFKTEISNYKLNASIYRMFENAFNSPVQKINSRYVIVESMIGKKPSSESVKDDVIEEYSKHDKDLRLLAYKVLLEKFNEKYGNLDDNQKIVLREYINNVSNTPNLKEFIDNTTIKISKSLNTLSQKVDDKVVKIKLKEVTTQFANIRNDDVIRDKHILSLMRGYELLKELKNVVK